MHKVTIIGLATLLGCGGAEEPFLDVAGAPRQTNAQPPPALVRCVEHTAPELIDSPTDASLAIIGDGLFVVRVGRSVFFTRWGQFVVDPKGFVTTLRGDRVQGLDVNGRLVDLQVRSPQAMPRPTSSIHVEANLDPAAVVTVFDPAHPESTSNLLTHVTVFDAAGVSSEVTLAFNRTALGQYDFHANVRGPRLGGPFDLASGTLTFDATGRLLSLTQRSAVTVALAEKLQPLTFDLGDPLAHGGTGLGGVTQTAPAGGTIARLTQDGVAAGAVEWLEFTADGHLFGHFTNSGRVEVGQLALANFSLARSLAPTVDELLVDTQESGPPVLGRPLGRNFGAIRTRTLDASCQPQR